MKLPPELKAKILQLAGESAPTPPRGDSVVPISLGQQAAELVAIWCREEGWPIPVQEYQFAPPRRWRFDLAWVEMRLAVEFQGGVHGGRGRHVRPTGFTNDCEKFSQAAAMGWRVMPVTYKQLKGGQLLAWIRQAMGAAKIGASRMAEPQETVA